MKRRRRRAIKGLGRESFLSIRMPLILPDKERKEDALFSHCFLINGKEIIRKYSIRWGKELCNYVEDVTDEV